MSTTQGKTSANADSLPTNPTESEAYAYWPKPGSDKTSVTVTRDDDSHATTNINDDTVTYQETDQRNTRVAGQWPAEADQHVRELISEAQGERERRENKRANHRNLNRMLTLFGAIAISFILTWLLYYYPGLPLWAHKLAPFSFAITILMDASFTVYAYIKHY